MNLDPECIKLLGIPYEVLDCYGVVKEFYRIQLGIELRSYYDEIPNNEKVSESLIQANQSDFRKVTELAFGDIIVIKLYGVECHIAVYIDNGQILHTMKGTGCIIDRKQKWDNAIAGIYRPI